MAEPAFHPWTVDDFLAWERTRPERHEFVEGQVRLMVGGTLAHHTIAGNLYYALRRRLEGTPCRVFIEGAKLATAGAVFYPDVVVSCAAIEPKGEVVPEPVVIIEVASRTTADYDRAKWRSYATLSALRHYLMLSQDAAYVESYARREEGWLLRVLRPTDGDLAIDALGCTLTFAEIYAGSGINP